MRNAASCVGLLLGSAALVLLADHTPVTAAALERFLPGAAEASMLAPADSSNAATSADNADTNGDAPLVRDYLRAQSHSVQSLQEARLDLAECAAHLIGERLRFFLDFLQLARGFPGRNVNDALNDECGCGPRCYCHDSPP
jgi:hypothetical protein